MSSKAQNVAAELRNDLSRRFSTVSDMYFASDSMPYFRVTNGTLAAGQQQALIKVVDMSWEGRNIIGASAPHYGHPIQVQVVVEALADYTPDPAGDLTAVSLLTSANMLKLMAAVLHRGERTELYLADNASAPALTDIAAAKLAARVDMDEKYRTLLGA